ncbi:gamma-glutamyl-gamma-aminobutyrate hydrolase family protein [Kutzneria buriramensis]|uniref:Putative glutamine amidotransferase n=1 Tax=Kutzneria buriramensis TaxID=1045776 RepID=A0A3E0HDB9_9PSEU|nr:gamma-glutamyl-gamma-aminobutyrate hydrolase family protein [Kutzneria buriramensis]REH42845.1 putative glutamine amidotransferase [Kutzneria buriramensis]
MVSNGSDRRPVIGVTTYIERARYGPWDTDVALLPRTYVDTVAAAGGNPVLLPPLGFADVSFLDGLVIAGGADVDPARYGESAHPETLGVRPDRDATEFALVENALAAGLPLIGVCRGMQVLNVVLGGTLTQHVPDVTGTPTHRPMIGQFGRTTVEMTPGSKVSDILGGMAEVSCSHHQAVDRLGDGLVITARSADGVPEAVEMAGADFVLGVQWHPEQDLEVRLFKALVARTGSGQ